MASITPYCIKQYKQLRAPWRAMLLLLLCLGMMPLAYANGIMVNKVSVEVSDNNYQVTTDFDISLNFVVEQALTHGVPVYFSSEFSLKHPRWYWLDEEIAQGEQTSKLSYNILTRQYRITRGALYQNFDTLEEALRVFGHQVFAPIPATEIKPGAKLVASVRMRLDVSQLPKPLQVNALATKDWDLDSGWYRWTMRTDGVTNIQSVEE